MSKVKIKDLRTRENIKRCPFCGSKPEMFYNPKIGAMIGSLPMIVCYGCGATVSFQECERDENGAIKRYNRRARI